MKKNKFLKIELLAIVLAFSLASSIVFAAQENTTQDVKGNESSNATIYRVLSEEQVIVTYDGKQITYRRIFIENLSRINEINKMIEETIIKLEERKEKIEELRKTLEEEKGNMIKLESELNKIEEDIKNIKGQLSDVERLRLELEEKTKNNILLSPAHVISLTILFGVICLYIIVSEILSFLSKRREEKPRREEKARGEDKVRIVEIDREL
ncbi:MAG: hypothetical protein QXZ20_00330 [Candidatus Aenigmatarchaeota archaeon]